ncbi:MAG TPA: ImcF-related family protein [Gemmatimonadaceae bacterium]|jgi:type VI secretion system protein ImpL
MARNRSTRWYAAIAALVIFIILAWLFGSVLTLTDAERTGLRVGLVVLGLIAAVALLWYLRPDAPEQPTHREGKDDALLALEAARTKTTRGAFDRMPIVFVVGTTGSCKTTIVTHSELDLELLSGDPVTDPPTPTTAANFWRNDRVVFTEASGALLADEPRWRQFVRRLRGAGFAAAVGRGEPPARAAVVCVSCDYLVANDSGTQLDLAAQLLRQRLDEAAQTLGLALPVYVVFTKADRIPHFDAWASSLGRDELRQPLGATLSFDADSAASRNTGGYAERLTPRIDEALREITGSLGRWRTELLSRLSREDARLASYELPREFGKLGPSVSRFLVEVCRPIRVGASPLLRGFYFVGTRRQAAQGGGAMPQAPIAAAPLPQRGEGATAVFVHQSAGGAAPVARTQSAANSSAQWVFLPRLFGDVVLADLNTAAAVARGGVRVSRLRRGLFATGIAAALIVAIGITVSWISNRSLAQRTSDAAYAVANLPAVTAPAGMISFPSTTALRAMDHLRAILDTLGGYEQKGPPLHYRWGLWRGPAIRDAGLAVWLAAFGPQLQNVAYTALVDSLRALPDAARPGDEYARVYGDLKAYLEMTSESARSTSDFLAPVLLTSWTRGQTLDADVTQLARTQFGFYATELARRNPFPRTADASLIQHTRDFLSRVGASERIYQYMLSEASKVAPPVRLTDAAPQAGVAVVPAPEMPGSFTARGWTFMQDAFRNADKYFLGERWVVGDLGATRSEDRGAIVAELKSRYRNEYVDRWRGFLAATTVLKPSGLANAAQEIGVIGGAQSPTLATLALVARNTNLDDGMRATFQPVHVVTPPTVTDKFVSDPNAQYAGALVTLQGALEQVANLPPPVDTPSVAAVTAGAQQALTQLAQAKGSVRQIGQKFAPDTAAARVGPLVSKILMDPLDFSEALLRTAASTRPPRGRVVAAAGAGGAAGGGGGRAGPAGVAGESNAAATIALNQRTERLCAALAPLLAKFPFTPDATADATLDEVNAFFAPGTGAMWTLYDERLQGLLEKQGKTYVASPTAALGLSNQFIAFFNHAAQVSSALYPDGAPQPHVKFTARGTVTDRAQEINLTQGTQVGQFTKNSAPVELNWPSTTGREASLSAYGGGRFLRGRQREQISKTSGDWALFRLVASAPKGDAGDAGYHAEWTNTPLGPIVMDFTTTGGAPILRRGWLGGMSCAPQATR